MHDWRDFNSVSSEESANFNPSQNFYSYGMVLLHIYVLYILYQLLIMMFAWLSVHDQQANKVTFSLLNTACQGKKVFVINESLRFICISFLLS